MRRALDGFAKEGGAGWGYHLAGWEIEGVDKDPQPRNPHKVHVADALEFIREHGHEYDFIHASCPCQGYSRTWKLRGNEHERMIAATREELQRTGKPYVIENVVGARAELVDPIELCGSMFGLPLYRHRLFECSFPVTEPLHGQHYLKQVKMGRRPGPDEIIQPVGNFSGVEAGREAMGMPWASRDGLREAIPPAYTRHIGEALLAHLTARAAA